MGGINMARFLNPPTQQIVDMTPQSQTNFYANVLANAQNNLERSVAAKQEAVKYYNSLPFYTQEDYDAVIGEAQRELSQVIEGDFPAPATVANKIMEINKKLQPGINALKHKDEQVKIGQQARLALGANYLGNDVANMSIKGADGNFVNPNTLNTKYFDADQIRKGFIESEGANLNAVRERGLQRAEYGYLKSVTSTGLDDLEKLERYGINSTYAQQLAEKKLAEMPEDFIEVMGGRDQALSAIKQLHWEAANNPAFAYKLTQSYLQPIKPDTRTSRGTSATDDIFKGLISRNYVNEGEPALERDEYVKKRDNTKLALRGKGGSLKEYMELRKKYPAILQKVTNQVALETAGQNLSSEQLSAIIAGVFYDMVADKEIAESKILKTSAEAAPKESGSFYSFLNNVPDTYTFTTSDGDTYTKKDLADEKKLLSDHTKESPVKMPLMENYVEVYHKDKKKNLRVPIDALANNVIEANNFVKGAYEIFNSNNPDEDYLPYNVPIAVEEFDDGSKDFIYPTVFRRDDKAYFALGKYTKDGFDIDINTASPLEEHWGTLAALKIKAFKDAYSTK